jgi:nucleotidyltransferase substrate binding protein (TIGR01987 family)
MKKKESLTADFENILARWQEVLQLPENDVVRDSAILRFELTFEVAWKLVQLLAREQGYEVNSPRQAFQRAFVMGWITDEEIWADIIRARNTAVHVYRQEYAAALYSELERYYEAFRELSSSIEEHKAREESG